jgi:hypothetical protein
LGDVGTDSDEGPPLLKKWELMWELMWELTCTGSFLIEMEWELTLA